MNIAHSYIGTPSHGLIISAKSGEKYIDIFIDAKMLAEIVEGVEKTQGITKHLGHRFQHIREKNFNKCSLCD